MDVAVSFSLLLLMAAGESTHTELDSSQGNVSTPSSFNPGACSCPPAATPPADPAVFSSASPPLSLGLLTVNWRKQCEGGVYLSHLSVNSYSHPVCHSETSVAAAAVLGDVCLHRRGCEGQPAWFLSAGEEQEGYSVTQWGATVGRCKALRVECKAEVSSDVQAQLQAYKVVTALLCCVLLILLLIRFTRPTVKALQKRLSDRRQSRWIGPTQSHSVSYHRGKAAVRCNDGDKRLSYPALDRLTVSTGDPPSNRNSYNF